MTIQDTSGNNQQLRTTDNVTFNGMLVSGLTASYAVVTDGSKNLASLAYSATGGTSNFVSRDSSGNTFANNFTSAGNSVVSAGSQTTLNAGSARRQILTGTDNQTFKLPAANTLSLNTQFEFNNNSTGTLTVNDNSNTLIGTVPSGGYMMVYATDISSPAGVWDFHYLIPKVSTWGTAGIVTNAVTATTFTGALSGNATTATSATSATNATNSTNVGITDDTSTNATMYPVWVTANTGNLPSKVSSTGITWNPSTALLTATNGSFAAATITTATITTLNLSTIGVARSATVNTTDATTTTLATVSVSQGTVKTVFAVVSGYQTSGTAGSNGIGATVQITARRSTGGNVTLIGSVLVNSNNTNGEIISADVDTGTQTIRIRVTGVAATNYTWNVNLYYC